MANTEKKPSGQREVDAYTQHVMSNIEPAVFKSLNLVQLRAIESAISRNAPFRRHPIDVRCVLPLFFIRLYAVILVGRDKRYNTRNKETSRKLYAQGLSLGAMIYILLAMTIPIAFILLYLIKSFLGIDIFPDQHLWDFF